MTLLKWLVALAVIFGGFTAIMYVAQRALMYFPERQRVPPSAVAFGQAEEVVLDTADGEKIIIWHVPPRDGRPVVLYFHGNGGSLRYRADRFRALVADGTGLVALSYRGYGGSTGQPTEAGLIADANAAYDLAVARYPAPRIVPWGESLGTGVAVALSATRAVGGLILESPFTSAADVGAGVYWYLPVRLLMKDQFRSDELIGKVHAPLLILHGERDRVVPFRLGQRLFALANEPKRFVRFAAGEHSDLDSHGAQSAVHAFLAEISR
jgi:fermentation-respiration switch protein FrsA (DUF1100 family)